MNNLSYKKSVESLRTMNEKYGDVWVLPEFKDCLLFAITEGAEAIDAKLRQNPKYFRNRDLNNNFEEEYYKEVCDLIMMIIKSLMSVDHEFTYDMPSDGYKDTLFEEVIDIIEFLAFLHNQSTGDINLQSLESCIVDLMAHLEAETHIGFVGETISAKMDATEKKIKERKNANQ